MEPRRRVRSDAPATRGVVMNERKTSVLSRGARWTLFLVLAVAPARAQQDFTVPPTLLAAADPMPNNAALGEGL